METLLITFFVSTCFTLSNASTNSCINLQSQFIYRTVSPSPGSSPVQSLSTPSSSLSDCLLLCSLNRRLPCRSTCYLQPPGLCIMYSQSQSGFNYQLPTNCQLNKQYRTDGFPNCREAWVGDRRFCVVQQRVSNSVMFNRSWVEYENGFGDNDNFWTGLKMLQQLTSSPNSITSFGGSGASVRFEMTKFNNSFFYCEYDGFRIGSAQTNYSLNYTRYASERSNIATDGLQERSLGMMFSTMDRDNDQHPGSCSRDYGGGSGWWFRACFFTNPNGLFSNTEVANSAYIVWHPVDNGFVSLKNFRILILVE